MIIKSEYNNINLYFNAVSQKCKDTFLEGIVDKVYSKYEKLLSYIISNIDTITPEYYIGDITDLNVYGINIITESLIMELKNSNINKIRYFKFCRDYFNFIKSKFKGLTDSQVILMIGDYYIKNTDISGQKLYFKLKDKYIQMRSKSGYSDNIIYNALSDMIILLNTKILRLS